MSRPRRRSRIRSPRTSSLAPARTPQSFWQSSISVGAAPCLNRPHDETDSTFLRLRLEAPAALLPELARFYGAYSDRAPNCPTVVGASPGGRDGARARAVGGLAVLPLRLPRPGRPFRGGAGVGPRPRGAPARLRDGRARVRLHELGRESGLLPRPGGQHRRADRPPRDRRAGRHRRLRTLRAARPLRDRARLRSAGARRRSSESSASRSGTAPSRETRGSPSSARRRGR